MEKYFCHSGGAIGSDLTFDKYCQLNGIKCIHHVFNEYNKVDDNIKRRYWYHTEEELGIADPLLKECAKLLSRSFPCRSEYVNNLLRRNYYQIKDVDTVYAVGEVESLNTIKGGTGWACGMAWLQKKTIYVYYQDKYQWFKSIRGLAFVPFSDLPPLANIFAGIGTRELNQNGENAIKQLLEQAI